ncbi:MAG: hypothetical protein WKH47_00955 [Actinomycetes bacterium]
MSRPRGPAWAYPSLGGAGWEFMLGLGAAVIVLIGPGRFAIGSGNPLGSSRWRVAAVALASRGLAAIAYRVL